MWDTGGYLFVKPLVTYKSYSYKSPCRHAILLDVWRQTFLLY